MYIYASIRNLASSHTANMQPNTIQQTIFDELVSNLEQVSTPSDSLESNLVYDALWDIGEDTWREARRPPSTTPDGVCDMDQDPEPSCADTQESGMDETLAFQTSIRTFGDVCTYAKLMDVHSTETEHLTMHIDGLATAVTRGMLSEVTHANDLQLATNPALFEMLTVMQVRGKFEWYKGFNNVWDEQALEELCQN